MSKIVICAPIYILSCNNMVTCKCKILNCIRNCCRTGCHSQSCHTTFKSCNSSLEYILSWISKSS